MSFASCNVHGILCIPSRVYAIFQNSLIVRYKVAAVYEPYSQMQSTVIYYYLTISNLGNDSYIIAVSVN